MDTVSTLGLLLQDSDGWLDSERVGARLQPKAADPLAIAAAAQRAGQLLAAWDGHRFWYPAFQFDAWGQPSPDLEELLSFLPREHDGTVGPQALVWMFASNVELDGLSPADVFPADPQQVICIARRQVGDLMEMTKGSQTDVESIQLTRPLDIQWI